MYCRIVQQWQGIIYIKNSTAINWNNLLQIWNLIFNVSLTINIVVDRKIYIVNTIILFVIIVKWNVKWVYNE